jgi:cell filamentation protein
VIEDPYLDPGSDCLRNRLGIRNADELKRAEGERTAVTLALLDRDPIPGNYDLPHLQAFHRRLFGDIYDWAGTLRTVTIAKEHSVFALPEHIERVNPAGGAGSPARVCCKCRADRGFGVDAGGSSGS